ncbi:MAG: anhydro-N-acetylmuramic acid kinase [Gammaproteobacteria bacterium]|jgi:anhydro-N-acetylmuramic acid kinase|nr:anhydro-N-acetylmuramic acid kinase [Gammaproteobacteria bacterium]
MTTYYAGLMSGTSLDAVDIVVAGFAAGGADIIARQAHPFPAGLRARVITMINAPDRVALDELGSLHRELGWLYGDALSAALEAAKLAPGAIAAAGCHGQTVRHSPDLAQPFTLQLGCGATAAVRSGVPFVTDFRSADMALGGQGAPLVPAFHEVAFASADATRVIVNIGGIANVTVLEPGAPVRAWDTGPGNTLLDSHCQAHRKTAFDAAGAWARGGCVDEALLTRLLSDPYFARSAPKSTGREYFNAAWLQQHSAPDAPQGADLQATLAELTARSIAAAITHAAPRADIYLCGGGAANDDLQDRLRRSLPDCAIRTTAALGIEPDWVEAAAFAWLARARLEGIAGNLPSATGASRAAILGALHAP